jgi:hypothetical protein
LSAWSDAGRRWPETLIAQHERKYGPDFKSALRARNVLFFVELSATAFPFHVASQIAHTALFVKTSAASRSVLPRMDRTYD